MPATVTLTSRFPMIVASLNPRVDAAMRLGAEQIANTAKANVHVQSGGLRDAIHVEDTEVLTGYEVVGGDGDAYWGHFEEFGTNDTPSHPFLIPAMESEKDAVAALVTASLRTL